MPVRLFLFRALGKPNNCLISHTLSPLAFLTQKCRLEDKVIKVCLGRMVPPRSLSSSHAPSCQARSSLLSWSRFYIRDLSPCW